MMAAIAAAPRSVVRASFDLARAGNFPSVASNVIAALVLSSATGTAGPSAGVFAAAIVGGCLIYAGGATFNDVADAAFDARHRPERAIPSGAVTRSGAAWLGAIEMAAGVALLVAIGASPAWATALVLTILAYDWVHKRWAGSVVLMAGCRVLLALTLASVPRHGWTPVFVGWVTALFGYIVVLSVIARWEYKVAPSGPDRAAKLGRAVGRLLAFIPLIDAIALLLVGAWLPAMICVATIPLGRWAQRLAAST